MHAAQTTTQTHCDLSNDWCSCRATGWAHLPDIRAAPHLSLSRGGWPSGWSWAAEEFTRLLRRDRYAAFAADLPAPTGNFGYLRRGERDGELGQRATSWCPSPFYSCSAQGFIRSTVVH